MTSAARRSGGRQRGGILGSLAGLLFIIVFCAAIYLARRPLMRFAGESWVVEDPLERADAILVLSDDNFFADRATRASELFRQKLAPVIVASGRRLRPAAGIAELMEHDLVERGVPFVEVVSSNRCRQSVKTGRASTICSATACNVRTTAVSASTSSAVIGVLSSYSTWLRFRRKRAKGRNASRGGG